MSVLGWVLLAVVCWVGLAVGIGLVVGQVIRGRNAQRPRGAGRRTALPPVHRTSTEPTVGPLAPPATHVDKPAAHPEPTAAPDDQRASKPSRSRGLDG